MINYMKIIFKPFAWVDFPKFKYFFFMVLSCMMFPLMQVFTGLMQKYLVNTVEFQDMSYMRYVYFFAAGILFMVIVLNPIATYLHNKAGQLYKKNLRELTIRKLLSYPYSFYESYQTGDLITRLREDLDALPASFQWLLLGLFYGGGSIIVMLFFSWQLSALVIFLCISQSFIMAKLSRKITENTDILQKVRSTQNQMLLDIIKSISFIKMASISRLIREQYYINNSNAAAKNMEINKTNVGLDTVHDIFEAVNILSVFGLGIIFYLNDMIDLGSVMAFLFLQDGVTYMLGNVQGFLSGTRAQIVNCNRIAELLQQEPEDVDDATDMKLANGDILIRNLSFKYPKAENNALNSVNLAIPKGKLTVIHGASGGGKSTLIKMLLSLYPIWDGSIAIGEIDYSRVGNGLIRDYYAYVEQSPYLFYDTIEANIRCSNQTATHDDIMEAAKLAQAHDFIMQKPEEYKTIVQEHGSNFSGGEKQRIAIARAFLKKANTVVFDEATSAVDVSNESYIYDCIHEMCKQGKTVLIIAHRNNAKLHADNVVHIEHGVIVNTGTN